MEFWVDLIVMHTRALARILPLTKPLIMESNQIFKDEDIKYATFWDRIKCRIFGRTITGTSFDGGMFTGIHGYLLNDIIYVFNIEQCELPSYESNPYPFDYNLEISDEDLPDGWKVNV